MMVDLVLLGSNL